MRKIGIGLKLTILTSLLALILFSLGITLFYFSVFNSITSRTGELNREIAELAASSISRIIDAHVPATEATGSEGIVFDEVTGAWKLSAGSSALDIALLFKPLQTLSLGNSGRALLVDERGYLVYYPNTKPFSYNFSSYNELQQALETRNGWLFMDGVYHYRQNALASFSAVNHPVLLKKGIKWYVFIVQEKDEVLAPLTAIIRRLSLISIIMVIALFFTGLILTEIFVRPIKSLRDGFEHIGRGDLDYRVKVSSGDEIGRLTESFNEMAEGMKKTTTSVAALNKETAARKAAEERMKNLSSGFAGIVSAIHDSISAIKQGVKSLLDEAAGRVNDKQKKAINKIEEDIDTLEEGVAKLADVARIEAGQLELMIKPVDVREVMRNVIFVYEPKIREKGLDLKLDIPKAKIEIDVDPDKINRVLSNLIENSIKFTEKGYIEISVRDLRDEIECAVSDTGKGIPRENLPKIFERFEHPGLGLSIAKGIIDAHKGSIWAESDPGKKTKFSFRLPKKQ